MNTDKLKQLARDLRKTPPRSPRDTLGGFVMAARMLDKARALLLGINGEYNFYPCGLGAYFWKFTGLDAMKFKEFVATGAPDEEVDHWIRQNATQKDPTAIIKWNNEMRTFGFAIFRNRSRSILRLTFRSFVIRQVK